MSNKISDKPGVDQLLAGRKKDVADHGIPDPENYMYLSYYGTYQAPDTARIDRRIEKKFRVTVVGSKSLLETGMNFHSYFRHTFQERFKDQDPEFIRFHNIVFDKAVNIDGSEISDPRTYSLDRLKQHCMEKGWAIDFRLYSGLKLRDVVFQFFIRADKRDESESFYAQQERDRRLHGLTAELKSQLDVVPEAARIKFEEV
jgi:hypothetical protein